MDWKTGGKAVNIKSMRKYRSTSKINKKKPPRF
jgi:hypothetical protein